MCLRNTRKIHRNDILVRITMANRGERSATLHVLPTIWFRNTWIWGNTHENPSVRPRITREQDNLLTLTHETLGRYFFEIGPDARGQTPPVLFTENETNNRRLFQCEECGSLRNDGSMNLSFTAGLKR
jgi:hypothetical protein